MELLTKASRSGEMTRRDLGGAYAAKREKTVDAARFL